MNRSRLLAIAAASFGLAAGAFLPSVALAETPPVGPLTATKVPQPPPGVIVKPPIIDPPVLDPGDVVWPTPTTPPTPTPTDSPKPPKPPLHDVPTVPPVVVYPDPDPTPSDPPSEPPSSSPTPSPSETSGGGSGTNDDPEYPGTDLPVTGASVGILLGAGVLLAAGGALLVAFTRRRRADVAQTRW